MPASSVTGPVKARYQNFQANGGLQNVAGLETRVALAHGILTMSRKQEVIVVIDADQRMNRAMAKFGTLAIGSVRALSRPLQPVALPPKTWRDLGRMMGQGIGETLLLGAKVVHRMDQGPPNENSKKDRR